MSKKTIIPILAAEVVILAFLGFLYFRVHQSDHVRLNPDVSAWQSRYIQFNNGVWHGAPDIFPSDEESGEEIDLLYGPFFSLPSGCYSISIDYRCDENQSFEVYSYENNRVLFSHEDSILKNSKNSMTFHFTSLKPITDLEVRFRYNGSGDIDIYNINIVPSTFLLREIIMCSLLLFFLLDACLILSSFYKVTSQDRTVWIDVCRGTGILLILLGHTDPSFKWLIFGFHVPLFYILSGYLYKEHSEPFQYIKAIFRRYMVPYFILCMINLIITLIRTAVTDVITAEWVFRYIKAIIYTNEWLPDCLPLWFLPSLFLTMTAYSFFNKLKPVELKYLLMIVCIGAALLIDRSDCPDLPWGMGQALVGVLLVEFGHICRKYSIIDRIARSNWYDRYGLLIVLGVCGINSVWCNYESTGDISSMQSMIYGHFPLWITGALSLSVCLMALSAMAAQRFTRSIIPLEVLGQNTIILFAFDFCMNRLATYALGIVLGYDPWYFVFPVKLALLIILCALYNNSARLKKLIP